MVEGAMRCDERKEEGFGFFFAKHPQVIETKRMSKGDGPARAVSHGLCCVREDMEMYVETAIHSLPAREERGWVVLNAER